MHHPASLAAALRVQSIRAMTRRSSSSRGSNLKRRRQRWLSRSRDVQVKTVFEVTKRVFSETRSRMETSRSMSWRRGRRTSARPREQLARSALCLQLHHHHHLYCSRLRSTYTLACILRILGPLNVCRWSGTQQGSFLDLPATCFGGLLRLRRPLAAHCFTIVSNHSNTAWNIRA